MRRGRRMSRARVQLGGDGVPARDWLGDETGSYWLVVGDSVVTSVVEVVKFSREGGRRYIRRCGDRRASWCVQVCVDGVR